MPSRWPKPLATSLALAPHYNAKLITLPRIHPPGRDNDDPSLLCPPQLLEYAKRAQVTELLGMERGRGGNRRTDTLFRGQNRKRPWRIGHAQLSSADPAVGANALAVLAADATGVAVPPVDGAAFTAASDDTALAEDSRASTAPPTDAAEGTVPLVAGSAADGPDDAAATADDAGAPPTDAAEFGGCCLCPFDRENIGISTSFDWSHSS